MRAVLYKSDRICTTWFVLTIRRQDERSKRYTKSFLIFSYYFFCVSLSSGGGTRSGKAVNWRPCRLDFPYDSIHGTKNLQETNERKSKRIEIKRGQINNKMNREGGT